MGSYSFKSSGKTAEQRLVETIEFSRTPIGIKTPLEIRNGNGDEIFVTYDNLASTVSDNLKNLLLTNWGERLGFYNFGANLKPLLSELVSQDDFDSAAISRINDAVTKWMPFISLENYVSNSVRANNSELANIIIKISYNVPALELSNKVLEINLRAM
jgi:phage baseplate assembly protein W